MKKWIFSFMLFAGLVIPAFSQSVEGVWRTVDDKTGESKSHIQLYVANGKMYGKILKTLRKNAATICEKCPGERKNQPIVGMIVVENMLMKDNYWQNGSILYPEKGKWYTCKMWLKSGDPNMLEVRGYIGPFFRTQTWYRVTDN